MNKQQNILYVSSLCSEPMMHRLFDSSVEKPHPAPQKFHSLLVKGLVANNQKVTCLVAPPITVRTHPNKKWWNRQVEDVDGVHYIYMPFYNHPILKLVGFKFYAFFFTLFWAWRTRGDKAMICDVLYTHACPSMKACKIVGMKSVGIVTDIPGLMVWQKKSSSIIRRWFGKIHSKNIRRMSHFVPLTDAMCDIINPERKKPYVVVEGLVDSAMDDKAPTPYQDGKRHITYTGTLNARYGVRDLVEGFMKLPQEDIILDIYGRGPMAEEMTKYTNQDNRVRFHGMVTNDEAVIAQRSSFLLVNPRPTVEEFTKYSFPSKNMEYMATGVPLLTAVLPGMPKEYHPYVFLFEDETAEGISRRIDEILSMPIDKVRERGQLGKEFVMKNKNNIHQAKRVIELINDDKVRE